MFGLCRYEGGRRVGGLVVSSDVYVESTGSILKYFG
jgi:hypothetical protein